MKYLLDTNAFSDIITGVPNVETQFLCAPPSLIRISSVMVKEIQYGRNLNPDRVGQRGRMIDSLLQTEVRDNPGEYRVEGAPPLRIRQAA